MHRFAAVLVCSCSLTRTGKMLRLRLVAQILSSTATTRCTRANLRCVTAFHVHLTRLFSGAYCVFAERAHTLPVSEDSISKVHIAFRFLATRSVSQASDTFLNGAARTQIGVLQWFARLWEIDQDEYWGYITNCGTEGNLHGILVGRENLPDGILYASRESHYSVFKCAPGPAAEFLSERTRVRVRRVGSAARLGSRSAADTMLGPCRFAREEAGCWWGCALKHDFAHLQGHSAQRCSIVAGRRPCMVEAWPAEAWFRLLQHKRHTLVPHGQGAAHVPEERRL